MKPEDIFNPFQIATLTHVSAQKGKLEKDLFDIKLKIFILLAKKYNYNAKLFFNFLIFIEWLIQLPEDLQNAFEKACDTLKNKGEKTMTDREALLHTQMGQRFLKRKIDEGIQKGRNEGRNEGIRIFIDTLFSLGQTQDAIIRLLNEKYNLSNDMALKAIKDINEKNP